MCARWRPTLGRGLKGSNIKTESGAKTCSPNGSVRHLKLSKTYNPTLNNKRVGCIPVAHHHSCRHLPTKVCSKRFGGRPLLFRLARFLGTWTAVQCGRPH